MPINPNQITVLVIDDDQTLCEMYAERLKIEGFKVEVAYDGEDGLEKAVKCTPNIILLDLMLPKVSGFDCLEILKSSPKTKNIPVIVLTALIQQESKQRELSAGAADYIIKSETMPMQVITKIKAVLEHQVAAQPK